MHDTLNDVINALPADSFQAFFTAWVDELRDAAADIAAAKSTGSKVTCPLRQTGAFPASGASETSP